MRKRAATLNMGRPKGQMREALGRAGVFAGSKKEFF
jgi:hypothetical protein